MDRYPSFIEELNYLNNFSYMCFVVDSVCLDCGSPEADWGGISYGRNSVGPFILMLPRVEFNTQ